VSNNGQWEQREKTWGDGVRRAALVTVGSEEAKAQLCHFYGVTPERVFVLPFPTPQNAIDIAKGSIDAPAHQDVRGKYGIKGDFLFYPAQFWPHKNHVNLLNALKLLKERGRDISLVLAGSNHGNHGHVENVARDLGVADRVHFCGFVPYEDILSFYREARALCYVSFFGPENLPPLEAMALGCPLILSHVDGVKALHGDGPVLADPRKPDAIADAVEFVLDHPGQMPARLQMARDIALHNDCVRYWEHFQRILDDFEPIRRCWP
jgi:glycosyltransferase involved in cell wall biosynthesis